MQKSPVLVTESLHGSSSPEFLLTREQRDCLKASFDRYAITFGLYKNEVFQDRLFPFGLVPRLVGGWEFDTLEKGLVQRITAINEFLKDIYGKRRVLKDRIIPEDFVYASSGFLPECRQIIPPGGIYPHIAGIDLVQAKNGQWLILEDNLRVPSGSSYPLIARKAYRAFTPEVFDKASVVDTRSYPAMLLGVMEHVNRGGLNLLLSPGRFNSAFFEHSLLAQEMGIRLAFSQDLEVVDDLVWYRDITGLRHRVGAIYRRISDEYLDPLVFHEESLIGVPGLFEAYRRGNVALVNAPGNGVADDKGIYYFVPRLIRYYLGEEPILSNAPTYLASEERDRAYILAHLKRLVLKDVFEAGGYGIAFGRNLSRNQAAAWRDRITANPRRFIAQEVIDFRELPVLQGDRVVRRKSDLRAFVLSGKEVQVWAGGLTRYAMEEGSFVVNSSQGGGFKDTWVLSR